MTIEAVREQGKVTSVTWDNGHWRMRLVDGDPVTENMPGNKWTVILYPRFPDAITAYRILKEGLEPPEGFTVECEGGRISQLWTIRDEREASNVEAVPKQVRALRAEPTFIQGSGYTQGRSWEILCNWPVIEEYVEAQRQEIDQLRKALEYIQHSDNGIGGCSSYYCVVSKPKGGQHTNGPCNCDEPRLRRMLSHLRWYAGHVLEIAEQEAKSDG